MTISWEIKEVDCMRKNVKVVIGLFWTLVLLVGCMGSDAQRIKIDGSATVLPITQAVVEDFTAAYPRHEIAVGASGTGGGFQKFINNESDIQNASRPIGQREQEIAQANDVTYYELAIAQDAIIIAVNHANTWVTQLSEEQLYNIFKANSEIKTWADINPTWPDTVINFYVPALDSGTFDYFHTKIMHGTNEVRADVTASQDLNVLVTGVEGDKNALGFFSYAYYETANEKVNALEINEVAPSFASISNNEYPLARELYIYVNKNKYAEKQLLRSFVLYYMDHAAHLSAEVGFVPLIAERYEVEKAKLFEML